MRTIITIILALLFISSVSFAQDTLYIYKGGAVVSMRAVADIDSITFNKSGSTVTDIEDNVYKTVKIGTQTWMAENLKTRKFNDGIAIPLVIGEPEWEALSTPGYCWYNNDSATYNADYGALYNWYAVDTTSNGSKNVCPTGWHVPSDAEWTVLTDYLGGEFVAGGKLKEAGLAHWAYPNQDATNETGFSALPGGYRYNYGTFYLVGNDGLWWSSTEYDTYDACSCLLYSGDGRVYRRCYDDERNGFSVRCLGD